MEEKINWKEMFENPIKKHSTNKIEEAIAKCLSDLVGVELEASVKFIGYSQNSKGVSPGNPVEVRMVLSQPIKDIFNK